MCLYNCLIGLKPYLFYPTTVEHQLKKLESYGHCFEEGQVLYDKIVQYPLFYKSDEEYSLNVNFNDMDEKYVDHFEERMVLKNDATNHTFYYLREIAEAEEKVKKTVEHLLSLKDITDGNPIDFNDIDNSALLLRSRLGDKFDFEQFKHERYQLSKNMYAKRLFVLSGSPGTGKSFELLRFVDMISKNGEKYFLLAPTGKATLRLKGKTEQFQNIYASTIDKFLTEKAQIQNGTLEIENLIVDEMSMVDLVKIYELILKINFSSPKFRRLILVGDLHQLPPIGYGKVFQDIITFIMSKAEYKDNIISLETNCRLETDQEIIKFARIFSGQNKNYEAQFSHIAKNNIITDKFHVYFWQSKDELQKLLNKRVSEIYRDKWEETNASKEAFMNILLGLTPTGSLFANTDSNTIVIDKFQIITPYRTTFYGALGINNFWQSQYRSNHVSLEMKDKSFKQGDKIIRTENYYTTDNWSRKRLVLSNGSIGLIVKSKLLFQEHDEPFSKSDFIDDNFELAYAITVHKSQGSGFEDVFVIVPPKMSIMSRELLYTALTRARKSVSIFVYGKQSDPIEQWLFNKIRTITATDQRRTSLFNSPSYEYSYIPSDGIKVKSRVEYIIYKNLEFARNQGQIKNFGYELTFKLDNQPFNIHPDFTLELESGKIFYWEHLGRIDDRNYRNDWIDRYEIYKNLGLLDRLITTDERRGISDQKINKLIQDIVENNIGSDENSIKYSRHHYSLNY